MTSNLSAFQGGDNDTMSLIALVMKFLALSATTPRSEHFATAEVLASRLTKEKFTLADAHFFHKFNLHYIEVRLRYYPHFHRVVSQFDYDEQVVSYGRRDVLKVSGQVDCP